MQKPASQLVSELEDFSGGKLKRKDDLERIIEISQKNKKTALLDDIAFTAKFVQGLFSIIQRGESVIDEVILERYIKEYSENLEKIKNKLKEIIGEGNSFFRGIFEEKYFSLTQGSLSNLNELCYDLSWYKTYLNEKSR